MLLYSLTVFTELTHSLLESMPMDDIVKLFNSQKILTGDEVEVVLFSPSDYLKKQLLLRHSLHLKIFMWETICDVLHNTKSMRNVSNQLRDGKLFIVASVYTYVDSLHIYVHSWLVMRYRFKII